VSDRAGKRVSFLVGGLWELGPGTIPGAGVGGGAGAEARFSNGVWSRGPIPRKEYD